VLNLDPFSEGIINYKNKNKMDNKRFGEIFIQYELLKNSNTSTLYNDSRYKDCISGHHGFISREAISNSFDALSMILNDEYSEFKIEWNNRKEKAKKESDNIVEIRGFKFCT